MLKIPCEKSNCGSEKTWNIEDIILIILGVLFIYVQSNPLLNVKFSYYHETQNSGPHDSRLWCKLWATFSMNNILYISALN